MKHIILLLLPLALIFGINTNQKEVTISGSVKDTNGNGLSASVNAGKIYAITDASGNYQITLPDDVDFLTYSAIGYDKQKIKINNRTIINIVMQKEGEIKTEDKIILHKRKDLTRIEQYTSPGIWKKSERVMVQPSPVGNGYYLPDDGHNTEEYDHITENGFKKISDYPLSSFSIDVDAASYSNVRRFINNNQLPPAGAVRTEEMINYFKYQYPQPNGKHPFSINTEISNCPWNNDHQLVLIGLQGKNISTENLPASNLVFLVDVSGSMMGPNRLPLVKASLKMLTDQLREKDKISIVVYAGNAGLVLPATNGNDKIKIKTAIDGLEAGGSTAGGAGIKLAYKIAQQNFLEEGNNRVILCTDGDFNVGVSSNDEMVRLIETEREKGIFLTALGYGMGNYKDSKMQQIADKGNGNHAYIDGLSEAKKVLVNEFGGTLFTIAKDVKLQVEFNPAKVAGYRLIGYENRMLNKEDFNDDKKDAGELGSGHTVTAIYEIIPAGVKSVFLKDVYPLKYQSNKNKPETSFDDEILTVKFRYKAPAGDVSQLIVHSVEDKGVNFSEASKNLRFATAVSAFGMLLRDSPYKGNINFEKLISIANSSLGEDSEGYRKEFVTLVKKAEKLKNGLAHLD